MYEPVPGDDLDNGKPSRKIPVSTIITLFVFQKLFTIKEETSGILPGYV